MPRRREDLTAPRTGRRVGLSYDREAFARFAESIARLLGTGRYLVFQTVVVATWITINAFVIVLRWDPYPFILLNLAFSTQAAYAAPLILLAQSRQEQRDRVQAERDREVAERTQFDTEFLAREIAGVRLMLSDVVTTDELREQLVELRVTLESLSKRLEHAAVIDVPGAGGDRSSP